MKYGVESLKPYPAYLFNRLVDESFKAGYKVTGVSFYRDLAEQAEIYAQGRDPKHPGPILSNSPAGHSMHNFRLAFDIEVIVIKTGKEGTLDDYKIVGAIGKSLGLFWGYDFIVKGKPFHDKPHFQWTGGLKDAQIFGGIKPKDPYEEYLKTADKYKDNFQGEIDRLKLSKDPMKDMKIYVLDIARTAKLKAQQKG